MTGSSSVPVRRKKKITVGRVLFLFFAMTVLLTFAALFLFRSLGRFQRDYHAAVRLFSL